MGEGERPATRVIRYELGDRAAARRAWAVAGFGAARGFAPLVLAVALLRHFAWAAPIAFWAIAAATAVLLGVRVFLQQGATRRRLRALVFEVDDRAVTARSGGESRTITRDEVGRIIEIEGALGGLRVEGVSDPRSGEMPALNVPRGGDRFGEVRATVGVWRSVERRPRRGLRGRVAIGAAVVAAIFFLPFAIDDIARFKIVAASVVALTWFALRRAARGR